MLNRRKFFSSLPFVAAGGAVGLSNLPASATDKKVQSFLSSEDFYELKCDRPNPKDWDPAAPDWPACEGTFKILKSQHSAICPKCGAAQDLYNTIYRHIYNYGR
jgi:hypothetical protein